MNIAMFTDSYLPNTDGVVSSMLAYKQGLEASGHRLFVFAPDADNAKKEHGVYRFAAVKFPPYPEYRAAVFPYVSSQVARKSGIELVHSKAMVTMGLAAMSFASRAKIPAMASLETMIPDGMHYLTAHPGAQKIGRRFVWSYLRWFYSNFKLVTAPSRHAQALLSENRIESEVLPSPIDTERFKPSRNGAAVKRELGLSGKKVVASVGRVVKEKNYSFLVKVASQMQDRDVSFLIVGSGPYLESLKREALAAGVADRFCFAGYVESERLADYYNAADCFAFPSLFETQGLTALEALSCGKPVCAMRGTPMQEVLKEGKNGYVFSQDEKDCAEKLMSCLGRKSAFAETARKTALAYSIPNCTEKLLATYKRLLE